MSKYVVTAVALDPSTGELLGSPRDEEIDTTTDDLFHHCHSPWEVEDAFEAFWNRLNISWEYDYPPGKEKVKVLKVVPA